MKERENFSSSVGSLLVLVGSAVGLGNIWRFPYMLGEYGGGAFIIIYVICMLLVSLPVLLSEIALGRRSQKPACGAIGALDAGGRVWKHSGFLFVLIPTVTLSYYCVIGGWTLKYLVDSCMLRFGPDVPAADITAAFGNFVSSPSKTVGFHFIFLLMTGIIILLGVRRGIEKFSKFLMPALFVTMVFVAVRAMTIPELPGALQTAADGVRYLFHPDFSRVTPDLVIAALGQAFFSLSIGQGVMITYGSYLSREERLVGTAVKTSVFDFVFAVIAGCTVIPAMFAYSMFNIPGAAVSGPGLVYQTLPVVFSQMPVGQVVSIFFFFSVVLAALTSSISLFEVPVSYLVESRGMSRPLACLLCFVLVFAAGLVCSLSFGPLSGIRIGGMVIFDATDYVTANWLMPLAGLVAVLFAGWKMKKSDLLDELTNGHKSKGAEKLFPFIYALIRYVAPAGVIAVALANLF